MFAAKAARPAPFASKSANWQQTKSSMKEQMD